MALAVLERAVQEMVMVMVMVMAMAMELAPGLQQEEFGP